MIGCSIHSSPCFSLQISSVAGHEMILLLSEAVAFDYSVWEHGVMGAFPAYLL